jgi:hypothetical protein
MVARRLVGLLGIGTFLVAASAGAEPAAVPASEAAPASDGEAAAAPGVDAAPAAPADAEVTPPVTSAPVASGPTVRVTFRTTVEEGDLRVQGPSIPPGGGACGSSCTLNITPGSYTVLLEAGRSIKSFEVYVRESSEIVVSGPNGFHQGLGLALLVGGGVVLSAGALVWYVDAQKRYEDERYGHIDSRYRYKSPDWVLPVVIAGAIGGGVTAVGAVLFLTARASADVSPARSAAARRRRTAAGASSLSVVPEVGPTGASLRVGWSF